MSSQAFIDGQNLYTSIRNNQWRIDLARFRRFLEEKYGVDKVYYFVGVRDSSRYGFYNKLKAYGYTLVFREHGKRLVGDKKGNVDTDIVFMIMSKLMDEPGLSGVILVSGDGDFFKLSKYLVDKGKLLKILVPSRTTMSSLYYQLGFHYIDFLEDKEAKSKIAL